MRKLLFIFLILPLTAFADTAAGIKAYEAGDFETAYKAFFQAALENDREAQYRLGLMYQKGEHVEQHDYDALVQFEKAGKQGHVEAMREAIRYHLSGWGVSPNRAIAAIWIKMSADAMPEKYMAQWKRFEKKLTTFERMEFKERLEKKNY